MALGLALASAVQAADTPGIVEQEIRRLDAQEAEAVLRGDYALIDELWADDFIVNKSPAFLYGHCGHGANVFSVGKTPSTGPQ
jgi:hypothetical protein